MPTTHDDRPGAGHALEPDELLALARLDIKRGDIAQALQRLKAAIAAPNPPDAAYSICGQVYLQLELPERALGMFRQYLSLHPGAPDETYYMGLMHLGAGRAAEALKLWNEVLQNHPSHSPALLYRAILSAQQGQADAARSDVHMLMKSTPVDSPYFKPAKDLLAHLDGGPAAAAPATSPASAASPAPQPASAYAATLAGTAYNTKRN